MDPQHLKIGNQKSHKSLRNLKITIDEDSETTKTDPKKVSPRSSLTNCDEKLILNALVLKIDEIVQKLHKEFNPIAQSTPFYLRKKPKGQLQEYLNYLCFTTLGGNWYVLAEAIRLFEKVSLTEPDLIHEQTVHRVIGTCCLVIAKFCYDGYNSSGFEKVLGVRKSKMAEMEQVLFLDV